MNDKTTGRPRKAQQDRPRIWQRIRSKVTRQIQMSANTAEMLDRYVTFATEDTRADKDEALILTMDMALDEFFKRDKLFMESLDDKTNPGVASTTPPPRAVGADL